MKQTHNALTMLLRAYRSVFKSAYLKGMAGAVFLTSVLAGGAANADNLTQTTWPTDKGSTVYVDGTTETGHYEGMTVSGSVTNENANGTVIISSGAAGSTNYISGDGSTAVNVVGTGTLTIEVADANTNGLLVGDSGAVSLGTINVNKGLLQVSGDSNAASISAETFNIGNSKASFDLDSIDATVKLGKKDSIGSLEDGKGDTINLYGAGKIVVDDQATAASIKADTLNIHGGVIQFAGNNSGVLAVNVQGGEMTDGFFDVTSGNTVNFTVQDTSDEQNLKTYTFTDGTINVAGTLKLQTTEADSGAAVVDMSSKDLSIISYSGSATGELPNSDNAQALTTAGNIQVSGASTTSTMTLKVSTSTLADMLVPSDADKTANLDNGIKLGLLDNSILEFVDQDVVDLSADYIKFAASASATSGDITTTDASKVKGINFKIGPEGLNGKDNFSGSLVSETLEITRNTDGSTDDLSDFIGANSVGIEIANSLTINGDDDEFTLDKSALFITGEEYLGQNPDKVGELSASKLPDLVITAGGTFQGQWDVSTNITVSGGSAVNVYVGSGSYADVKFNNAILTLEDHAAVTIAGGAKTQGDDGEDQFKTAVLDLSKGQLKANAASTAASLKVQDYGTLIVNSSDIEDVLANGGNAGVQIQVSGSSDPLAANGTGDHGTIQVLGNLDLTSFSGVSGSDNKSSINVSGNGLLQIEGNLTMTQGTAADAQIDFDGVVETNNLTLNNEYSYSTGQTPTENKSGGEVVMADGTFLVHGSVNSKNDVLRLSGSSSLGAPELILDTEDPAVTANVNVDIELTGESANSGALSINQGVWELQSVSIASGALTVGDGDWIDDDNQITEASATLEALTLSNTAAKVTVNKDASLTVGALAASAATASGQITVDGTMTINGQYTAADPDNSVEESFGVAYEDNAISVSNGATLVFDDAALQGLYSMVDGDLVLNEAYGQVTLAQGSTIKLNYTEENKGEKLTADDAVALKTQLAGGTGDDAVINGIINVGQKELDIPETAFGADDEGNVNIKWADVKKWADMASEVTNEKLVKANVYEIDGDAAVKGAYGSLTAKDGVNDLDIAGNTVLTNAAGNGSYFAKNADGEAIDLNVSGGLYLTLENGGKVGTVSLNNNDAGAKLDTVLNVFNNSADAVTEIEAITSGGTASSESVVNIVNGLTKVTKDIEVNELNVEGNLEVGGDITVDSLDVMSGKVTATGSTLSTGVINTDEIWTSAGTEVYAKTINYGSAVANDQKTYEGAVFGEKNTSNIAGYVEADEFNVNNSMVIAGTVKAKDMNVAQDALLIVGVDALDKDNELTTDIDESAYSRTGDLLVGTLSLNGATLIVDPAWNLPSSYAVVEHFDDITNITKETDVGTLDGDVYVGQNAVLGLGFTEKADVQALVAEATQGAGLTEGGIENVMVLGKTLDVEDGMSIYMSSMNFDDFTKGIPATGTDGAYDHYMDSNSAIVIDQDVFTDAEGNRQTAIEFGTTTAATVIHAQAGGTAEEPQNAKVIITGEITPGQTFDIFNDGYGNEGVTVNGTVVVQSANGFWQSPLSGDDQGMNVQLTPSDDSRYILRNASNPVYEHLMKYAWNDVNYADASAEVVKLSSGQWMTAAQLEKAGYTTAQAVDTKTEGAEPLYLAPANSAFLNTVLSTGNGQDAETVARMAVYGGAAEVAMAASSTTYEAISARMGMGNPNGNLIMADNANGAGIWLAPVYKNHESDDFDAQGVDYGVDLDLYGVALGADYTFAPGFRAGAMFNVGSGDADGQGAGSAVSNDFDYWSAALYAGFAYENFSVAGDVTYTAVDNDMDASTSLGKYSASMDADVFTVGLTAQYKFEFAALDVTPHLGVRYSYIDIDDYSVGDIAESNVDEISVFSIPVGVSLSKDFATASGWVVKPALDLTVTANTGDDEVDSDIRFNGVDLTTDLSTEFMDSVTYGATLGLQVQKDSFQFGLGVNYTGSENTDEYGVAANARFTF